MFCFYTNCCYYYIKRKKQDNPESETPEDMVLTGEDHIVVNNPLYVKEAHIEREPIER